MLGRDSVNAVEESSIRTKMRRSMLFLSRTDRIEKISVFNHEMNRR